jgi:hypothetical protein
MPAEPQGTAPQRKRPWSWRWLVVLHDLPPMPPHSEVIHGWLTRREAEHQARMIRMSHNRHIAARMVRIEVVRG